MMPMRELLRIRAWKALLLALAGALLLGACATPDMRTESDETELDRKARVRLELAQAYFSRGQNETALDEVKLALGIKASYEPALNLRGLIYSAMNEPALAEESFKRALAVSGERNADVRHNYGWFLCQQRRYPEADAQFRQALAVPNYREASRTLLVQGVCQARSTDLASAEKTLMKAFELEPGNPAINVNLAEVLYRRADYERARFYVRRVNVSDELVSAQSLWLAVRIERKTNQMLQMRVLGRQLATQFPKSPEAQLFEKGQFDEQ